MTLLRLPRTVIEAILCNLPAIDLFHCLLVNKYLSEIITASTRLELKTLIRKLANLGAEINPFSSFSVSECLRILNESTQNWTTLTPDFIHSVIIPNEFGSLTQREGVLLFVPEDGTRILYTPLPRTKEESLSAAPKWHSVDLGVHYFLCFGLFKYEHDLLALVTSTLDVTGEDAQTQFNIYIRLRRFSIRGPHPRASIGDIFVMKSFVQKPDAVINVVGRHLVLMVFVGPPLRSQHPQTGTYIYVYNWEVGALLMKFQVPLGLYESFVFLNEHLFLMTSLHGQLDIFHIPIEPDHSIQHNPFLALRLPPLRLGAQFVTVAVNCAVNPIARSSWSEMRKRYTEITSNPRRYVLYEKRTAGARSDSSIPLELDTFHSNRPFILKSENALCVFQFAITGTVIVRTPDGRLVNTQEQVREEFTMLVHRKALLRAVEQYMRPWRLGPFATFAPPSAGAGDSTQLPQNVAVHNQIPPFPDAAPNPKVSQRTPVPAMSIPWAKWGGPQVTRWLKSVGANNFGNAMGERCVRLACELRRPVGAALGKAAGMPVPYNVLEFNDYLCWKAAQRELAADQGLGDTYQRSHSTAFASGVGGAGTDKLHEYGKGGPATVSANGVSEGNQTTAPNDPGAAVAPNSPGEGSFPIPSYDTLAPYDLKAAYIQSWVEHAMFSKMLNSVDSTVFHPRVECRLPSRSLVSNETVSWEQILIDEERLMGVCFKNDKGGGIIQTMEIHHFG